MSEAQTSVEEQPAAPIEATPAAESTTEIQDEATPVPTAEETTTTVAEPTKDEEPTVATEASAPPKKEFTGEGILGYKTPGGNFIKKLAGFQKKFFWFGSEAVDRNSLHSYIRGEKQEIANHNVAWSSQTGKGLLYFSKFASEKSTPAGIINLADIIDLTEDGTVDFSFMLHGSKHIFQASTTAERESWIAALKTNSAEATEMVDNVKNSEAYKNQYSNLSKPAVVVPAAAAATSMSKEPETKKEQKAEVREEKKEEKAEVKEEKKEERSRKSRSASRKRNSIFGNLGLGSKKEEPVESKEEQKVEAKELVPVEPAVTESVAAPLDAPAVAAAVVAAPIIDEPAETRMTPTAPVEQVKPAPAANKRNSSIFGSLPKFGQKKPVQETKAVEAAPAVLAKETDTVEPVSAEAPVIPAPEATEPLEATVASPATVPVTEVTNGVTETEVAKPEAKVETKAEPAQRRKSSLPFGLGSKEKKDEVEGEKPKSSPFARFRQTIKGKPSTKAAEKASEKSSEKTEDLPVAEPVTDTPATAGDTSEITNTTEPIASQQIDAAPTAAPQVTATA